MRRRSCAPRPYRLAETTVKPKEASSATPLWRHRDFVVLLVGQLLSGAGSALTSIAYPLLVLAMTHSPAKAGTVAFVRLVPFAAFGLLAGVAADRWNRKWLMIGADAVRAVAVATALWGTFSSVLRNAPRLDELDTMVSPHADVL